MVMFKAHTKAAGMIVAAALLAALCTAFAHTPAYASEVESPFTKVESFAEDIRDYVGGVADEAAAQAEAEALEGRRQSVVAEADAQLGVPYFYGGTTPSGFDCSGFTRWVFSHALGRELPRTAAASCAPPSTTSPPTSPSESSTRAAWAWSKDDSAHQRKRP